MPFPRWTLHQVRHQLGARAATTTTLTCRPAPGAPPAIIDHPPLAATPLPLGPGPLTLPGPAVPDPPHRVALVQQVAAETGYPRSGLSATAFTQQVAERLHAEDPRWGRRVNSTGPLSNDTVAYQIGDSPHNPFSVDIILGAGGPAPRIHWSAHGRIGSTWIAPPEAPRGDGQRAGSGGAADQLTLHQVTWLHHNVRAWPTTSTIIRTSIGPPDLHRPHPARAVAGHPRGRDDSRREPVGLRPDRRAVVRGDLRVAAAGAGVQGDLGPDDRRPHQGAAAQPLDAPGRGDHRPHGQHARPVRPPRPAPRTVQRRAGALAVTPHHGA